MSSGGARARSGPPPDPDALRRGESRDGFKTLPAEGREGDAPEWPLSESTDREADLWAAEWKRPQSIMWESNGQEIEVALYVRTLTAAEKRDSTTAMRTLLRQQQEALGISIPGMLRNKWVIGESPADSKARPATRSAAPSARDRFKVVPGGKS